MIMLSNKNNLTKCNNKIQKSFISHKITRFYKKKLAKLK